MLRVILSFILLISPFSTQAETIGINWSALSPGQYQKLRTNEGAQLVSRYVGPRDGLYLFELFYGLAPNDIPNERIFLDRDGQFVKSIFVSGATTTFEPHDCSRTLGACSFTMRTKDGKTFSYTQIAKRTARGLKFTRRDASGKVVMRARMELRDSGLLRNLTMRTRLGGGGYIREVKLVK
ncbi:MAG: hypothetical protein GXP03_05510 [Alphaproteobacteria bacterium]|nr:hypothetical protein [Alphaproteobacteria bacterium]